MTNLTEQYYNGTLPDGFYYFNNGREKYIVHYDNIGVRGIESVSVMDKVPSFEQWQAKLEENTKLKELLKECRYELEGEFGVGAANLVEEIDEVLQRYVYGAGR